MSVTKVTCFFVFFVFQPFGLGQEIKFKVCSTTPGDSACQQIARNLTVACDYSQHSVDCLLNIQSKKSHLGRITGEEALLGANLLSDDVVVLGEIINDISPSQTVVIAKNDIPSAFINLKGKKLCHSGYIHDSTFSRYLLQELEKKVIELSHPECLDNVTLLERHISTLSDFFGESCRPGPWTQNDNFDQKLKEKYSSLCKLCNNGDCNFIYSQPFNDSLKCLLEKNGDVAVTTLAEAELFFNSTANSNSYKYLCKDGSSSSSSAPCIWSSKLPDLFVSEKSSALDMVNYLRNNIKSRIRSTTLASIQSNAEPHLIEIFKLKRYENIALLEDLSGYVSLKKYVTDHNTNILTPKNQTQCSRTLKWCTYSNLEHKKCEWLSQAAVIEGIQPVVECVRSEGNDELSCLDDIKKTRADIVVASSDYAYISLNKGLTSIAFPETDTRNLSTVFAVKRADDNSINTFESLKGKSACIPQFGGKEHLALIHTTRALGITDIEHCDYGETLNDFIGDSCVPGVRSSLIKESTDCVDKDKMCARCRSTSVTKTATYCNADTINKYFGNQGAVDCLLQNSGDFAVITRQDIKNETELRVLCKNNTVATVTGLNVDTNCALFVFATSEVVVKNDNIKRNDIQLALYEFEKFFGQSPRKPFHLFDTFENVKDLLFLDSTPGLNFEDNLLYIKKYKQLLKTVGDCKPSSSTTSRTSLISIFLLMLIYFFTV